MAFSVRRHIAKEVADVLKSHTTKDNAADDFLQRLRWCIRTPTPKKNSVPDVHMFIPYKHLQAAGFAPLAKSESLLKWANGLAQDVDSFKIGDKAITVHMKPEDFVKSVIADIVATENLKILCSDLMKYRVSDGNTLIREKQDQKVVIEYSSPNIAKPFHAGHLRSTVLGNVLGNLYEYVGHNVTRINYLGDWGTQFGYIGVGLGKYFCQEKFEKSPINHYYEVYVQANKDSLTDPTIHDQAKQFLYNMEKGREKELEVWRVCREASIQEYKNTYRRLGVKFDEYHGESMYKDKALALAEEMRKSGLVHSDAENGMLYLETQVANKDDPVQIKLVKSDGTTLYVTRDITAAVDRYEKYKFDHMLYIVEHGQNHHFTQLLLSLQAMGHSFAQRPKGDFHVGFGRVEGMSTRKGEVVFLTEILDTAQELMVESMQTTKTTKIDNPDEFSAVADILAVSAIVIQDLKERRLKPYKFDWTRMLRFHGDTGVFLQYTHARLCSLERKSHDNGIYLDPNCDTSVLKEKEALSLVMGLAKFDEALYSAYVQHEPYHLVQFLFKVCHLTGRAFDTLHVQNQPENIAKARLLLFHCARLIIAEGLNVVGVTPLERM